MRRWLMAGVMLGAVIGLVRADDVYYRDRTAKKQESVTGKIEEETATGLTIVPAKGKKDPKKIAAEDIDQIIYTVPGLTAAEFRAPGNAETKALRERDAKKRLELLDKAAEAYQGLDKDLRGHANARRYIQYKAAQMVLLQIKDDPTKAEAAIKALTEYKTNNVGGWETVLALKELARLQESLNKMDDAQKTYEELAEIPDLPKELKLQSELLVCRLLMRANKDKVAEKRLQTMAAAMPKDDPQRPYIQAYLADCQLRQGNAKTAKDQLEEALKASTENRLRGVIHNLLGDYYRATNQNKEAFWHYLRVDALYNEDPEEQAKALYYLRTLFDKEKGDTVRAKDCTERLRDARFAGTTYQAMLPKEEKPKEEKPVEKK